MVKSKKSTKSLHPTGYSPYTVSKEIDFPRYNMKCRGEDVIPVLRGIFHVVSCFALHFIMLYRGNFLLFFGQCNHSWASLNENLAAAER